MFILLYQHALSTRSTSNKTLAPLRTRGSAAGLAASTGASTFAATSSDAWDASQLRKGSQHLIDTNQLPPY